jgi:hypothetical protein
MRRQGHADALAGFSPPCTAPSADDPALEYETMTATNAHGMRTSRTGDGTNGMRRPPVSGTAAAERGGRGNAEAPGIRSH